MDGAMATVSHTMNPLITIVNNPIVTSTNGSDKMVTTGLIIALTAENIKPASKNVATVIGTVINVLSPNIITEIHSPKEQMNHLIMNDIELSISPIIAQSYFTLFQASARISAL